MRHAAERFRWEYTRFTVLETRHEPLVGVGRRRGEGEDSARVLDDAADVPPPDVREAGVGALLMEERFSPVPQRRVHVHAGPVVVEERLRHKGRREPGLGGDALDDVLVEHQLVGHPQQRVEPHVDLGLAGGPNLVVLHLDLDAHPLHGEDHLGAQVLEVVHRRNREVAFLVARLVAQVHWARSSPRRSTRSWTWRRPPGSR